MNEVNSWLNTHKIMVNSQIETESQKLQRDLRRYTETSVSTAKKQMETQMQEQRSFLSQVSLHTVEEHTKLLIENHD